MNDQRASCLGSEELVDGLDGTLAPSRDAHLQGCAICQAAVASLARTLDEVRGTDVPEPSPFFWGTVNRRVEQAIAVEGGRRAGPLAWLRWETVLPLAGIAALLVVLGSALRPTPPAGPVEPAAEVRADTAVGPELLDEPEATDDALALVADLAGTLPEDDVDAFSLAPLPDFGATAAVALTAPEQRALEALLREAVDRPKS